MTHYESIVADLAQKAMEIIFLFDRRGLVLWSNWRARQITDYSEEELKRITATQLFPNIYKLNKNELQVREPENQTTQTSLYRKNHTCFAVDIVQGVSSRDSNVLYCIAVDVSEKEENKRLLSWLKEEANESMRERNEFVANITHELRTPVSGILGHTRNALGETSGDIHKVFRIIERCCADMTKIIDNILDFSKLEAGKFTLEYEEFDFHDFMNHIVDTHSAKIYEKGLKLVYSVDENVPTRVIGDAFHIAQIINNLISNAIKFTSVGTVGMQIVKTMQSQEEVELFFVITDTGIGVREEDKERLFQSFTQVDASISRTYGGTGLGLAVCKQIVDMMQGRINVESEIGKGSIFTFSIHVRVPEAEFLKEESKGWKDMNLVRSTQEPSSIGSEETILQMKKTIVKVILCVEME